MSNWNKVEDSLPDLYDIMGCDISAEVLVRKYNNDYDIASVWVAKEVTTWRDNHGNIIENITHWKTITPI